MFIRTICARRRAEPSRDPRSRRAIQPAESPLEIRFRLVLDPFAVRHDNALRMPGKNLMERIAGRFAIKPGETQLKRRVAVAFDDAPQAGDHPLPPGPVCLEKRFGEIFVRSAKMAVRDGLCKNTTSSRSSAPWNHASSITPPIPRADRPEAGPRMTGRCAS